MSNGGPAFPVPEVILDSGKVKHAEGAGMTLRDYFASQAMQGAVAAKEYARDAKHLADFAYQVADAMLIRRDR